jgi:hypothetical protein
VPGCSQDDATVAGLIYDEARAALGLQRATVEGLRRSAGVLCSFATVAMPLVGGLSVRRGSTTFGVWWNS